jgi:hypothetical protein
MNIQANSGRRKMSCIQIVSQTPRMGEKLGLFVFRRRSFAIENVSFCLIMMIMHAVSPVPAGII